PRVIALWSCVFVWEDICVHKICLSARNFDKAAGQISMSGTNSLDFGAEQMDAGLKFFKNKGVKKCFTILNFHTFMILQSDKKVYNRSMTKERLIFFLLSLFFLACFSFKGSHFLDPDFGWHLTMGKYIISHGIPPTDPFSYTMPSYPFIDHEWLTNVLIAKGDMFLTYDGVAGVFGLVTIGAILISLTTLKKRSLSFALIPFFLTGVTLYSFTGVRP